MFEIWWEEEAALIQQIGQKNLLGIHLCSVQILGFYMAGRPK